MEKHSANLHYLLRKRVLFNAQSFTILKLANRKELQALIGVIPADCALLLPLSYGSVRLIQI